MKAQVRKTTLHNLIVKANAVWGRSCDFTTHECVDALQTEHSAHNPCAHLANK